MLTFYSLGLDIKDYGNITYKPLGEEVVCDNMKNLNHVAACMKEVMSVFIFKIKEGKFLSESES